MAVEANVNVMVTVRLALADDADAIGRIQVETWRAAYTGLMPDEAIAAFDVASRQRLWRDWLGRETEPGRETFVAEREGDSIGFAGVGACDEDGVGELYTIYVLPEHWGSGAGRALLEHAEESMRAFGFGRALLWVMDGNERAIRFYEAAGWEQDGSKVEEFQGATVTELRYRKAL